MEDQIVQDLTIHRGWKGFRFEALDALKEAGCLNQSCGAKSVTLTEAWIEHVRALATRYLGEAAEGQ